MITTDQINHALEIINDHTRGVADGTIIPDQPIDAELTDLGLLTHELRNLRDSLDNH